MNNKPIQTQNQTQTIHTNNYVKHNHHHFTQHNNIVHIYLNNKDTHI